MPLVDHVRGLLFTDFQARRNLEDVTEIWA